MKAKLILIRGIPGSGKTTLAKKIAEVYDHTHIEDADFLDESEDSEAKASKDCFDKTKALLESGETVVVSNYFTKLNEMQPYMDLVNKEDLTIVRCTGRYKNSSNVPPPMVQFMADQFEQLPKRIPYQYDYQVRAMITDTIAQSLTNIGSK